MNCSKAWYHGTTTNALEDIRRDGYIDVGNRERSIQGEMRMSPLISLYVSTRPIPVEPVVYVSPQLRFAKDFAIFKAQYWRAEEGEQIPFVINTFIKKTAEQYRDAQPIVLKLCLPDEIEKEMSTDESSPDGKGYFVPERIPAECITKVINITERDLRLHDQVNNKYSDVRA